MILNANALTNVNERSYQFCCCCDGFLNNNHLSVLSNILYAMEKIWIPNSNKNRIKFFRCNNSFCESQNNFLNSCWKCHIREKTKYIYLKISAFAYDTIVNFFKKKERKENTKQVALGEKGWHLLELTCFRAHDIKRDRETGL